MFFYMLQVIWGTERKNPHILKEKGKRNESLF